MGKWIQVRVHSGITWRKKFARSERGSTLIEVDIESRTSWSGEWIHAYLNARIELAHLELREWTFASFFFGWNLAYSLFGRSVNLPAVFGQLQLQDLDLDHSFRIVIGLTLGSNPFTVELEDQLSPCLFPFSIFRLKAQSFHSFNGIHSIAVIIPLLFRLNTVLIRSGYGKRRLPPITKKDIHAFLTTWQEILKWKQNRGSTNPLSPRALTASGRKSNLLSEKVIFNTIMPPNTLTLKKSQVRVQFK